MAEPGPKPAATPLKEWLEQVHRELGSAGGARISPDEQTALLDLARIAAHRSERIAAPLTLLAAPRRTGTPGVIPAFLRLRFRSPSPRPAGRPALWHLIGQ